jgi:hypothetical protein
LLGDLDHGEFGDGARGIEWQRAAFNGHV